jgi:hypothetical protein
VELDRHVVTYGKHVAPGGGHVDRVAKHALIFFALYQAPSLCQLFTHPTPRVPPEKFTRFVQTELPVMVEKLMQGSFTSLRAFVEDTRWVYVTL